jgi:hypothetical protein
VVLPLGAKTADSGRLHFQTNRTLGKTTDHPGISWGNGWLIIASHATSKNSLFSEINFELTVKISHAFIDSIKLTNLGRTVR